MLDEERFRAWRQEIGLPETTVMSPDVLKSITNDLRNNGLPISLACRAHGVSQSTFNQWLQRYPQLRDMVDQARAIWEKRMFKKIQTADFKKDPKAWSRIAWGLERTNPDDWASKKAEEGDAPKLVVHIGQVEKLDIKALLQTGQTGSGSSSPSVALSASSSEGEDLSGQLALPSGEEGPPGETVVEGTVVVSDDEPSEAGP